MTDYKPGDYRSATSIGVDLPSAFERTVVYRLVERRAGWPKRRTVRSWRLVASMFTSDIPDQTAWVNTMIDNDRALHPEGD